MKPISMATSADPDTTPPGPSLRDPAYQDLCAFLATYADAAPWTPHIGDWVIADNAPTPRLVIGADSVADGPDDGAVRVHLLGEEAARLAGTCTWLPTLDQLRLLMHSHFGTIGFFAAPTRTTSYWYMGEIVGMEIRNMVPLSEGATPEEAAIKALLMRMQR